MIETKDLRIGNIYKSVKFNLSVTLEAEDIRELVVRADGADIKHYIHEMFEAIPLTEEWLVRAGFKHYGDWFIINNMFAPYINISLKHNKTTIGDNEEYEVEMIKYVSQLQNLYFALTGEELTL